jgi:hypothetical protein
LSKICLRRDFRIKYGNAGFITFILKDFISLSDRRTREHDCKNTGTLLNLWSVSWK